jgi:hypothetical protein
LQHQPLRLNYHRTLLLLCCNTLSRLQWVDDHTHMPTLERLPKHIPIIAQAEAADRIRPLGFKSLTTISHGQTMSLCDGSLQLTATAGALVGPPWSTRQNGYVLRVGSRHPSILQLVRQPLFLA